MKTKKQFSTEDIEAFKPESKVGLLATVNEAGLPHITLITTIQANGHEEVVWGQFTEGKSKENVLKNPKTGFLIMTLDKNLWRGKTLWRESKKEGSEYIYFNKLPMWRYNSYFGLHTIHYMDLVETTEKASLPLAGIVLSALLTKFSKAATKTNDEEEVMNEWTVKLLNKLDTLKFLSYVAEDGFPVIIPLLQCQAADSHRLVFHPGTYTDELLSIKAGTDVAVFGLTLAMQDVLVRGKFAGYKRQQAVKLGIVDIDWVYNSMPPLVGQIYPSIEMKIVEDFDI
ncbi:hypothetical protein MNBD_BACTEROID07-1660 [hydrothermal vent metagenome]|uniref:Uncharacterized protein n=1 Tax=hydrothermal vent metagenome TaxID=652676 RepID=A0A3B0UW86_9ZZZZ